MIVTGYNRWRRWYITMALILSAVISTNSENSDSTKCQNSNTCEKPEDISSRKGLDSSFAHLDKIKSNTSPDIQEDAAKGVIERLLPDHYTLFTLKVNTSISSQSSDTFQIIASDGKVQVIGSSGVATTWGVMYYLKKYCKAHISWEADQLNLPETLPSAMETVISKEKFRYYQNVCTLSYSMAWWNWNRWQREIDWMALNGINLPLAFIGQEEIFRRVYLELNVTQDELDEHFAGPAFFAWGRMGNIRGWGGPIPSSWYSGRLELQHLILKQMRQLGMIPVLPAFAGHIPKAITKIYPEANVTRLSCWANFNEIYSCSYFLHPTEPLFKKIGTMFINEMSKEYNGTDHVYNGDPFNEVTPASNDVHYLREVGAAIYDAMVTADQQAIWLMQGWLFFSNPSFWQSAQSEALLTSVPLGRMLVLDLATELAPQYSRLQSFFGQPFIFCMLHNFGGVQGMYGMVHILLRNLAEARSFPNSTMIGTGLTPEGINQNYIMYDFMLEMSFRNIPLDVNLWATNYSIRRYGINDDNLNQAWILLMGSIYNDTSGLRNHGQYLVIKRPNIHQRTPIKWYLFSDVTLAWDKFMKTLIPSPNELKLNMCIKLDRKKCGKFKNKMFRNINCKRSELLFIRKNCRKVLNKYLNEFQTKNYKIQSLQDSPTFNHDLVDLTRQNLQNIGTNMILNLFEDFDQKNLTKLREDKLLLYELYKDLEIILATSPDFLLGNWVNSASQWGDTPEESSHYVYNALNQISLWGPDGNIRDYAIKQWSGVVSELISPRWMLFLEYLENSLENNVTFNQDKYNDQNFKFIEQPFTYKNKEDFPTHTIGNSVDEAIRIYKKYQMYSNCLKMRF